MMRSVFWLGVVLAIAVLAYCVWPLVGAAQLAAAAQRGDAKAVIQRVDLPELRRSIARQIVRSYVAQSGRTKEAGALGRSLAVGVGASMLEPYVADMLTPENITSLLRNGDIKTISQGGGAAPTVSLGIELPRFAGLFDVNSLRVLTRSYFAGPTTFVIPIEDPRKPSDIYGVRLHLSGSTWRLAGLDLPEALTKRLAGEVAAREKAADKPS